MAYFGLFLSALVAATILPAQSEALLAAMILAEQYSMFWLVLVATVGNSLGSVINWLLGRGLEKFRTQHWFPIKPNHLKQAQQFYQKYGWWSVLLSWFPVIGDPITVIAGFLRMPLLPFIVLVVLAKCGRYTVLAWLLS